MHKKGQFFLIAALITTGLLFGLTSVINSAQGSADNEDFYSLSREINFETKRVLDYGTYHAGEVQTEELMRSFLVTYADYIAQEKVVFLFGNEHTLEGIYFRERALGSVGVVGGGLPTVVPVRDVSDSLAQVSLAGETITVVIGEIPYTFELLEGQNFFFVIIQEDAESSYVATN